MASAINPIAGSGSSSQQQSTTGLGGTAPSEQMFLQLLVAQLKNQDPLNPTDSTQFVSQLAQFSELEQVIAIRGDIESQQAAAAAAGNSANNSTDNSNSNTTGQPAKTNS